MYKLKPNEVCASEIAKYLNSRYSGTDINVKRPTELRNPSDNTFCFCEHGMADVIEKVTNHLVILAHESDVTSQENITFVISESPQKDFYRIVNEFFMQGVPHCIDASAFIKQGAQIGMNVNIGKNSLVDEGVTIGNNTYIGNNVVILGSVTIGTDCIVKDGSIIGSEGFAFIEDEEEIIHIPQFGDVLIGNRVWIGANVTIERPFLGTTRIENSAKIDDLCHVGQGCYIGEGSQLTAGCILARFVKIGKRCFLGVGSAIKENLVIDDGAVLGMGSIVVNNLDGNSKYMGIPAKKINVE